MLSGDLREIVFVAFDLETTGIFPFSSEIIEIGAVKFNLAGELSRFETLVAPEKKISPESEKIHGINEAMVKGMPKIREVLPAFNNFIAEAFLVAHNANFDVSFLAHNYQNEQMNLPDNQVFDTKIMGTRILPDLPRHRLSSLLEFFGTNTDNFHRALIDSLHCKEVFLNLLNFLEKRNETVSLEHLRKIAPPLDFKIINKNKYPENLPENFRPLEEAIKKNQQIKICYKRFNRELLEREITPLEFVSLNGQTYLDAFCHLRNEKRTFKLSKITRIFN